MISLLFKFMAAAFAVIGIAVLGKACYYELRFYFKNQKRIEKESKVNNLVQIIDKHGRWDLSPSAEANDEAKTALKTFYIALQRHKPDKKYIGSKRGFHLSYLSRIVEIRRAFKSDNYVLAIHEITSLIHYEGLFQGRIYYNLIHILNQQFEEKASC